MPKLQTRMAPVEIPTPKESTEIKDPALKRLSEMIIQLKWQYGSLEKVGNLLGISGAGAEKWINGELKKLENIQVGSLRRLAEIKGWTIDYLLHYLEGTTPTINSSPKTEEGFNLSSLSREEKLRLNLELAIWLNQAQQEMEEKPNPEEILSLSKIEKLKLSKLFLLSVEKAGLLLANISHDTKLTMGFLEGITDAAEDLVVPRKALNLIAPHCFKFACWEGARPARLSEERFKDAEDLLAAIRNGNGGVN